MLAEKIGFIGGGNMAEAMLGALLRTGVSESSRLYAADVSPERCEFLAEKYGIETTADNCRLFAACELVVLAIKPQVMQEVLAGLMANDHCRRPPARKLVVSIAAGIPLRKLEAFFYNRAKESDKKNLPLIRVMPNTPALVLTGMCGMSANSYVTEADKTLARTILEATGRVIEFSEDQLDAVTAVSGSGPAYVFYLAEAMSEAGISLGLAPEDVKVLVEQTLAGAVQLLKESKDRPGILREKVTSPGGTTEAALRVMEENKVNHHIVSAISAACIRAGELSNL